MNRWKLSLLCLGMIGLGSTELSAADGWHLPGWTARAEVRIAADPMNADVDTVGVTLFGMGRGRADGADFRVVDSAGKPLPFQLAFHDAARYSILLFQARKTAGNCFVYFGNSSATKPPEMVLVNPKPGSGAPTGGWIPKAGLVLTTWERPRAKSLALETNPETVGELVNLLAGSPRAHGAKLTNNIADGYNPFGASDYYISSYRGWLRIPADGEYRFCTASNEASFSFLNGKDLVHWPGRHTVERGLRGEKNAKVSLTAGLHFVEYYQEETTLDQMAFLGWRKSGDEGPFEPIPDAQWVQPHPGEVVDYRSPNGPLLAFQPVIRDSLWPMQRSEGQYTRVECALVPGVTVPESQTRSWDFGDGQSATGRTAEHVYLTLGNATITLRAAGQEVRYPLDVFEIEHVTSQFREGTPKAYAALVRSYAADRLSEAALRELAHLYLEAEDPKLAATTGTLWIQRFPNAAALDLARMRRLVADATLQSGDGNLDATIANYQAALVPELPAAERLELLARLVRLVGQERQQPQKGIALLAGIEQIARSNRLDDTGRRRLQQALIAVGDLHWEQKQLAEAMVLYRRAESMRGSPIPPQVRAARLGAYPNSLREYAESGNTGAALDLVDQWEEMFPTDKPSGQSTFWRGKLLLQRGQLNEAIRRLNRAVIAGEGAAFETEARWLLGLAREQLGQGDQARREWAALVRLGIVDEFVEKAQAKLQPTPANPRSKPEAP
ncbi:PKD domain-containing protein [Tuwongella immobilis]|uniref:Membrane protein: Marine sediment metagenome DNA, contig: S03H2_L01355 n=1 Tax=Tuwongella immobilis TaxID=692036 RepID=A0A6C2YLV2_9BACT